MMTRQQALKRLRLLMLTLDEVRDDLALDIEAIGIIGRELAGSFVDEKGPEATALPAPKEEK